MATPQEVQEAINKANSAYIERNDVNILNVVEGCCGGAIDKSTWCLFYIKKALQFRQDVGLYDEYTDILVNKINEIV